MKRQTKAVLLACMLLLLASCGNKAEKVVLEPPSASSQAAAPESGPTQQSSPSVAESAPQQAEIKLYLNGNRLVLTQPPVLVDAETVMVPVAEICEAFSRSITAEPQAGSLTLTDTDKGKAIVLTDNDNKATVNGAAVNLAAPAKLTEDGVMLMALSDFRTLFDADNKYQPDIFAAYITESGLC